MSGDSLTLEKVREAQAVLVGVARHTGLVPSGNLSRLAGGSVYLKTENMQRTGSFKIRGAYVKLQSLTAEQRSRGVVAASAGNHAQGVAVAAAAAGAKAVIVMPESASLSKVAATRGYGAEVVLCGHSYQDAARHAQEIVVETGATLVAPFDDYQVMAGQGTVGLEIAEDLPDVDVVLVPVGGGGLIAGVATALKGVLPRVRIIGVQAAGAAAVVESFRSGHCQSVPVVKTIADGIAVGRPGDLTFPVIRALVDDVIAVEDEDISRAIVYLLERAKLVVEGAGAVGVAALMSGRLRVAGEKAVVVLSGGNVDMNSVARTIEHGLTTAGRYLVLRTHVLDQPGHLYRLLKVVAEAGANVLDIQHYRAGFNLPLNQAEVLLTLETRDAEHGGAILTALTDAGFEPELAR